MLDAFDDFFQMHTLFKIPVFLQKIGLIHHIKGIVFDTDYFEDYAMEHFYTNYLVPAKIANLSKQDIGNADYMEAGKALVVFQ